jgi:Methyltransferase FkbM domain
MEQGNKKPLSREQLFQRGFFLQRMTAPDKLLSLIRDIRPQRSRFDLVRIGSAADGGYLVPNDLEDMAACFSPGVDTNASFETDLQSRFGIGSHLADYSVPGPPKGFQPLSFTKRFLGTSDNDQYITLDSWMMQQPEFHAPGDFILQMDIEGAEYATLLSARHQNLSRFRVMVIEFHNIENWSDKAFFDIVTATFHKLLQDFIVVHNHPNNCCGVVNMGGVLAPRVFELTFLRRDRSVPLGPCHVFPHPLDSGNIADRPDLPLPRMWYQSDKS